MNLVKCPFCGTPALATYSTKVDEVFGGNRITVSIGCATCAISFKKTIDESGLLDDFEAAITELARNWNRRA